MTVEMATAFGRYFGHENTVAVLPTIKCECDRREITHFTIISAVDPMHFESLQRLADVRHYKSVAEARNDVKLDAGARLRLDRVLQRRRRETA